MKTDIALFKHFVNWLVAQSIVNQDSELLDKELTFKVHDPALTDSKHYLQDFMSTMITKMDTSDHHKLAAFVVGCYLSKGKPDGFQELKVTKQT